MIEAFGTVGAAFQGTPGGPRGRRPTATKFISTDVASSGILHPPGASLGLEVPAVLPFT
jgi:hypothetical protein